MLITSENTHCLLEFSKHLKVSTAVWSGSGHKQHACPSGRGDSTPLTCVPADPKSRRWRCWRRNVFWRTTCRGRHELSVTQAPGVPPVRWRVSAVEHLLPLVVGERDALRRHFEVDHGGRRGRSRGDGLRGGLLNRLVTRQRLQRNRTQVPHVTRCTGPQTTQSHSHTVTQSHNHTRPNNLG